MSDPETTTTAVDPANRRLPTVGYNRWYEDELLDHRQGDCRPNREAISCLTWLK